MHQVRKRTKSFSINLFFLVTVFSGIFFSPGLPAEEANPFKEQIKILDRKIDNLEKRLKKIEALINESQQVKFRKEYSPLSIKIIRKEFISPGRGRRNNAGNGQINLVFEFINNLDKDIRAFQGVVIFKDLFDQEIHKVVLNLEKEIKAKKKISWEGSIDYNPSSDGHLRLRGINKNDLRADFEVKAIAYSDGSREIFSK